MPLTAPVSSEAAVRGAVDKIAASRVWLLKEKPFFGILARALLVEPKASLMTVARLRADDGLEIHPRAIQAIPFPSLCARISHLAMHAALGALARRGARNSGRWNLAHDLALEPLLRAAGLSVAAGALPGEIRDGMSAEEIYELLPEDAAPLAEWRDLSDAPPGSEEERSPPPGAPRGTNAPQDKGEGAAEERRDEPAPHELRARELAWKLRLAEALEVERQSGSKTWGTLPAWIDAMVSAVIAPPPNWALILQRSVAALARSERTYLRPSRRQSALADDAGGAWPELVTMPGRKIVRAGQLVAVVDTSGSIDDDQIAAALGAICAAATAEGVEEVRLVQADATVTRDELTSPAELLTRKVAIAGRGGTDFAPALLKLADEARLNRERCTVVYVTDLDGHFPDPRAVRELEVLWVSPIVRPVPFGRVFRLV